MLANVFRDIPSPDWYSRWSKETGGLLPET